MKVRSPYERFTKTQQCSAQPMQSVNIFVFRNEPGKAVSNILEELEISSARRADHVAKNDEEGAEWIREHTPDGH